MPFVVTVVLRLLLPLLILFLLRYSFQYHITQFTFVQNNSLLISFLLLDSYSESNLRIETCLSVCLFTKIIVKNTIVAVTCWINSAPCLCNVYTDTRYIHFLLTHTKYNIYHVCVWYPVPCVAYVHNIIQLLFKTENWIQAKAHNRLPLSKLTTDFKLLK